MVNVGRKQDAMKCRKVTDRTEELTGLKKQVEDDKGSNVSLLNMQLLRIKVLFDNLNPGWPLWNTDMELQSNSYQILIQHLKSTLHF